MSQIEEFPAPWEYQEEFHRIIAANGRIVCVISTGTLGEKDSAETSKSLADLIVSAAKRKDE